MQPRKPLRSVSEAEEIKIVQAAVIQSDDKPIPVTLLADKEKFVYVMRGANGYNLSAIDLKNSLTQSGLKVAIVSTDAHIAQIGTEIAADDYKKFNYLKSNGLLEEYEVCGKERKQEIDAEIFKIAPKAGWEWPAILRETLKRNAAVYQQLLVSDVDVIIYADMNKNVNFPRPYILDALQRHFPVLCYIADYFQLNDDPDYADKLTKENGGISMHRSIEELRSVEAKIGMPSLNYGGVDVAQLHSLSTVELAQFALQAFGIDKSCEQVEVAKLSPADPVAVAALTSGVTSAVFDAPSQQVDDVNVFDIRFAVKQ
jgi:hypothetical protein